MKDKRERRVGLLGTDSLQGREIKNLFERKNFPGLSLEFFDSDVQEEFSKLTEFNGEPRVIRHLDENALEHLEWVFLAGERDANREFGEKARRQKIPAIDLSGAFNGDGDVPVVVAGVNDHQVRKRQDFLFANPHPLTIFLSHLLHPLARIYGLAKAVAFALQPVSALGEAGIQELANQSIALLGSSSSSKKVFKEQVAFNLISPVDRPDPNGFSTVEKQVAGEVRRVLSDPALALTVSLIQAPIFHTYSIMSYIELSRDAGLLDIQNLYKKNPFIHLNTSSGSCPLSPIRVAGKEKIFLGRIKIDPAFPGSLWLWTVADNLTSGSVLNALEIVRTWLEWDRPKVGMGK